MNAAWSWRDYHAQHCRAVCTCPGHRREIPTPAADPAVDADRPGDGDDDPPIGPCPPPRRYSPPEFGAPC